MIAENLTGIFFIILTITAVFGVFVLIMSLPVLSFIRAVVPANPVRDMRICHWVNSKTVMLLIPLAGCLFGTATGYYAEWWSHNFDTAYTGAGEPWWTIFGAPGDGIANTYGGDWQDDESWYYRGDITFWNGCVWMILATVTLAILRILVRSGIFFDAPPAAIKPSSLA